jgi:hypothetical protein
LGVEFPRDIWPRMTSVRERQPDGSSKVTMEHVPGTLTEVQATHWPNSFRELLAGDGGPLRKVSPKESAA